MSTTRPTVVSPHCERVIRLLMDTHAQHLRGEVALRLGTGVRGRLRVLPASGHASLIRREGVLIRLVSITEAFTADQLRERLERHAPVPRNKFMDNLYAAEEKRSTLSWDGMKDAYRKWVPGVSISGFKRWNDLISVTEARNAVVHGLGEYTTIQRRNPTSLAQTSDDLERLGFTVTRTDDMVVTTATALTHTASLLRGFLEHLDAQLTDNP